MLPTPFMVMAFFYPNTTTKVFTVNQICKSHFVKKIWCYYRRNENHEKQRRYSSNIVYLIFPFCYHSHFFSFLQENRRRGKKLAIRNEKVFISYRQLSTRFFLAMNNFFRYDHLRQTNCF